MSKPMELLQKLFDEGSFCETHKTSSDCGIITGFGNVDGAVVYAFAQDAEIRGGAVDRLTAVKLKKLYGMAVKNGSPIIGVYNSKGGDINAGHELMSAYSDIIAMSAELSGVVPQISLVNGLCGGVASTLCCMSDIVIMTEKSEFFLTPPFLATDGKTEGAGTAENAAKSGVSSITVKDEDEAASVLKRIITILPQNNLELSGNDYFEENTAEITASMKGADIVSSIADKDSIIELHKQFGKAALTALGSIGWRTVGFVATNKTDDKLTPADSAKIARFVNFCDAFSIPVVSVIDTLGFEATVEAELAGSIRDSAKLAQSYSAATTSKISLITGNAIGASAIAMNIFGAGSDFCIAYRNAIIAPVPPKAAASLLEISEADYVKTEASAEKAAELGFVDRIIEPAEARTALLSAIDITSGKRVISPSRKHVNFVF